MPETKPLSRRKFLHVAAMAGAYATVSPLSGSAVVPSSVPATRLRRLAKGANICQWFRFVKRDNPDHFENYITDSEANQMRQMGLTHVRLCLQPTVVMDQKTGAVRDDHAAFLVKAIERFHRADLLVVIDLHNEDRPSEIDPAWQNSFVRFWGELAGRLRQFDPDLTVLEIINEPVFAGREAEWDPFNARLAAAIRKSAPDHTIMTSGAKWGGIDGLTKLALLEDANVVYSFHCYDPFPFTHQGATWAGPEVKPLREVPYPSSPEAVAPLLPALTQYPKSSDLLEKYGEAQWNKAKLQERFQKAIAWGKSNNAPLYCGEFGVYPAYAKSEHRANWFHDFGEVLAENKIGWSVWGWDEGFGLNRRYVDGKPQVDQTVATALGLSS